MDCYYVMVYDNYLLFAYLIQTTMIQSLLHLWRERWRVNMMNKLPEVCSHLLSSPKSQCIVDTTGCLIKKKVCKL